MFRNGMDFNLPWSRKTMSAIQGEQAESCEACLRGIPPVCLFDPECNDRDAEILFTASFLALETPKNTLHSIEQLKHSVFEQFPSELALLSRAEHELVLKLLFFSGKIILLSDSDICAGYHLVRRLWCKVESTEQGLLLTLPRQLMAAAVILLTHDSHKQIRTVLDTVDEGIQNTLYLYGIMQADGPFNHLKDLLSGSPAANPVLIKRWLCTEYDYWYDHSQHFMLIHPGVAHPGRLISSPMYHGDAMVEMEESSLIATMDSLDFIEKPLWDKVRHFLRSSIRPELSLEDSTEDLLLLAKQDIQLNEFMEVLSSMTLGIPSEDLKRITSLLKDQTPRWITLNAGRLQ